MSDPSFEKDWYGESSRLTRMVERHAVLPAPLQQPWIWWIVGLLLVFGGVQLGGGFGGFLFLLGAVATLIGFFQLHGSKSTG